MLRYILNKYLLDPPCQLEASLLLPGLLAPDVLVAVLPDEGLAARSQHLHLRRGGRDPVQPLAVLFAVSIM